MKRGSAAEKPFEHLFKPMTIKGISVRNRIVLPPMNTNFAEADGSVGERFTKYYVERGRGGTGMLIVSSAYIDPAARKRQGALLLHDDALIPKLKTLVDAVHDTGARILQQLNHNGRLLTSSKELKTAVTSGAVGPSAIPHLSSGQLPHPLSTGEIAELVEKFGQAARRAKEAGFDGVELHGAHGYLINQFYSVYSNHRTDAYGGNLENRMRFPLEVYRRVRELTGTDFLISYRVSGRVFEPVETPFEDVIALCQRLEQEGVDLLHVSAGSSETPGMLLRMIPSGATARGCYADLAAAIKAKVTVPVIAVGRINTPEIANRILRDGKADFVATGRALIADPYWPAKALKGETHRIRRCIACNQGCMERLVKEQPISCMRNPEVGREGKGSTASTPKQVMVIGGGPGGMEAALVAASRGHRVALYEKASELGGQSLLAAIPPGKEEFSAVGEFFINELSRLEVDIHLNQEVTPAKVERLQPDVVILATGALPLTPDLPGMQEDNVVTAWDVLHGKQVGHKVMVVGGALVGAETALFLAQNGKEVVLVDQRDGIALDVGPLNRARLTEALTETGVVVKCQTRFLGMGEKGALLDDETGNYDMATDTVVLALGMQAQDALRSDLEKVCQVYAVGDCVTPRKMFDAVSEAYDVAMQI